MESSPRLQLPYLQPAQAQKHVTANEAFRMLDAVVNAQIASATTDQQPAAPVDGEAYIIPDTPSGTDWSSFQPGSVAAFQDGAWREISPTAGWRVWVADSETFLVRHQGQWVGEEAFFGSSGVAKFGVNAAADTTNRLTVKSDAVLFSHDDVTPGAGDVRFFVNKAAQANVASLIFADAYQARAEIGLIGDDRFSIKVSEDGGAFVDALIIDGQTGDITAPEAHRLKFATTINTAPAEFSLRANGKNFEFSKQNDDASVAGGSLFLFQHAGGNNAGNPFWQGVHYACTPVSEGGAARYPRFSFYWSYTAQADPSDLRFNISPGNAGTLKTQFNIQTQNGGEIFLNGGNVHVGATNVTPSAKLQVDGAVRVKAYAKAALPSASAQGDGAIVYVSDDAGGAVLAFSDGAAWRRVTDRALVS